MKKSVFAFLAASLCLAACQIEIVDPNVSDDVLSAQIEQKEVTKTVLGESNNVLWSENDQIVAFMKSSYGHKYQIKPSFAGKTYADFSRVSSASGDDLFAGMEWDHNVAYYPYSESIECVKSGDNYALEVVLPAEQTYEENSFGNGTWPMVAVSKDNNITFKNVCGGIKLQLKGTQKVKSITLQGKNNEKLAGAATVTAYTDDTKPAIVMAQDASTTVTLNCGEGGKLNESTATEFIIALPPVLFSQGFTVTITDSDGQTYIVETDKANTVLRSSVLVMPVFKLGNSPSDKESEESELIIPVTSISIYIDASIQQSDCSLYEGEQLMLFAKVKPADATNKTVTWSSSDPSIASVSQTGLMTAIASGETRIYATAGGVSTYWVIFVLKRGVAEVDYIDEYGVNHGKGVVIGQYVWAPVNCGYHETDYKWGKLYQWGRKYGQGYEGDIMTPELVEGPVSDIGGNHKNNANVFYYSGGCWLEPCNEMDWHSGVDENVKTSNDPCPDGWRVPNYSEFSNLIVHTSQWTTNNINQPGYWCSGGVSYTEDTPQIFLPAAGYRNYTGDACGRSEYGYYWTSKFYSRRGGEYAYYASIKSYYVTLDYTSHIYGYSVRCVQE